MRLALLIALVTLATALGASAQSVNWVQYIDPTDKNDDAYGVCLFGDYLAVVGEADQKAFVALLDRITGEVVKTWIGEHGRFYNCLSIGDRLYAVKDLRIYVFDRRLNVVKIVRIDWYPRAISFDGSYLYVAGWIYRDVDGDGVYDWIWRIEKRTLDLGLVAYREFYSEWEKMYDYNSHAKDIAINSATGNIWVVGERSFYNKTTSSMIFQSLFIIFNRELDAGKIVEYPKGHENNLGSLLGICFDEAGNAYIVGRDGVAKFDKSGNILAVKKLVNLYKIACVGGRVYVFGVKSVGGYGRHVLYVFDEDLNLLGELILNKGVEVSSHFWEGRPAFDGRSLYVAGPDYLGGGKGRIVVYSILPFWRVMVVDEFGRPMLGVLVEAVVGSRYFVNRTGEDGVAWFSGVVPERV